MFCLCNPHTPANPVSYYTSDIFLFPWNCCIRKQSKEILAHKHLHIIAAAFFIGLVSTKLNYGNVDCIIFGYKNFPLSFSFNKLKSR